MLTAAFASTSQWKRISAYGIGIIAKQSLTALQTQLPLSAGNSIAR
ncbi:MAG: hypothetical protein KME45_11055 [Stenomitos rutilans HA7619-LM2]|nr:hypothetical protein [Stenomitos rutilans HA7619-LM2]